MDEAGERDGGGGKSNGSRPGRGGQASREERLAAALRQNLGRRKAQARARTGGGGNASAVDPPGSLPGDPPRDPRADPPGDPEPPDPDPA